MTNRTKGNAGEDLACRYLQKNGYEILERNKHYSRYWEAITRTKFENIKKGVQYYLAENKVKDYRIDIVGITLKPELKIDHLKNVSLM